jgi:hypothetical protein
MPSDPTILEIDRQIAELRAELGRITSNNRLIEERLDALQQARELRLKDLQARAISQSGFVPPATQPPASRDREC